MYEVGIKAHFSAAHRLIDYKGSCASFHGHNWEIEVYVSGDTLDSVGILVDFRELKCSVSSVLEQVDHCDLNEVEAFRECNPTSENIARFLFDEFSQTLDCDRYSVSRVVVHETPGSVATYTRG
jgi:6-pyruvoyltetrahydropterin/6-carboxytetrahydropterin synthase